MKESCGESIEDYISATILALTSLLVCQARTSWRTAGFRLLLNKYGLHFKYFAQPLGGALGLIVVGPGAELDAVDAGAGNYR